MTRPDAQPGEAMLAPAHAVARFIAGGPDALLEVFAASGVTIIENFEPYVFAGQDAVVRWAEAMRAHARDLAGLRHDFGGACDFASNGETAYFSLPTTWRGLSRGRPFTENGGWAFVLARDAERWRVRAYAWAVTLMSFD
jgi:hypothetical protein